LTPQSEPPTDDLTRRAWEAYLRQELTAPAAALAEYARGLAATAAGAGDGEVAESAARIAARAEHLLVAVRTLTGPDAADLARRDPAHWRAVRHDLRADAGYIVMACEDVAEAAPLGLADALAPDVAHTLAAARRVIELIDAVVRFGQNPSATSPVTDPVRDMLARLPSTMAGTSAGTDRSLTGRILVVDDNEYGRDLVARMLAQQGHEVEVVPGGEAAQDRLADPDLPPVDLVLLDVMMPGMTGPELLRSLKADPQLWHLPVIMVSALGEDDSVLACIAAGAEDYLTRPIRPELLRARIAGCLEKKRLRDREAEYQARIDSLVRAIFPPAVVREWEQTGTIRPRRYEQVGVLFLDVVGFTAFSERFRDDPAAVVRPLQQLVQRFEDTVRRHGVQKVKTIGDGFLAVAGLPDPDPNPAATLVRCGLDLIDDAATHPAGWPVRVGVHVGPVVAGVLGKVQFSFDVWGHTVNAANRVEGHGRPGVVTLSADAWQLLGGSAIGSPREVEARGIGVITVWDFERWTRR
jgi:class 3 adenylate cyclase